MQGQDRGSQSLHLQLLQSVMGQVSLSFHVLGNNYPCLLKAVCDHISYSPALILEQAP